jgi:prepilin-type N-terminal cleavage/methylation domain-containing protein
MKFLARQKGLALSDSVKSKGNPTGFTLIELLLVIAIIGLITTLVLASFNDAKKKARDARRLADIKQIRTALDLYYDKYNAYPGNTDNDSGGWDVGYYQNSDDPFISSLVTAGIMIKVPGDPLYTTANGGYRYYRYPAGTSGCDATKGAFYVLGIYDMEKSGNPHPTSPGWSCPSRNWQGEFDWVVGKFENGD